MIVNYSNDEEIKRLQEAADRKDKATDRLINVVLCLCFLLAVLAIYGLFIV